MFENFDDLALGLWRAAVQASLWLALALLVSRSYVARPARAHWLLCLMTGAALLSPVLAAASQACGWGLLIGPAPACSFRVVQPEASSPSLGSHLGDAAWLLPRGLLLAWVLVGGWLLLRLVGSLQAGKRCFGKGTPVEEPALAEALRRAARGMGLDPLPRLVCCPGSMSPLVWYWSETPRVVLPALSPRAGWSWEPVLRHELAHLRRGDAWTALLAELLTVVLWWNPLAWLVRQRLLLAAEFACDDWVLAGGTDGADYADALLALEDATPPPAGVPAAAGALAVRVRRLLRKAPGSELEPERTGRLPALLVTFVLAAGISLLHARPGPLADAKPIGSTSLPSVSRTAP
jgi:Zn-dependent protease with chaperone function